MFSLVLIQFWVLVYDFIFDIEVYCVVVVFFIVF